MAKTPMGVSVETNCVTRAMARLRTVRLVRRSALGSSPMSATPTATLNNTTAGTRLLARA